MTLRDKHQGFIFLVVISAILTFPIIAVFSAATVIADTSSTGGKVSTADSSLSGFQLTCEQGQIYNYSGGLS